MTDSTVPGAAPRADSGQNERLDLLGLSRADFEAAAGFGPGASRALGALYREAFRAGRFEPSPGELAAPRLEALRKRFFLGLLEPIRVVEEEGEFGATAKALLRLPDGETVECVRIPVASRGKREGEPPATLCLSSQAGCRMGCAFCETGSRGLARNLSAAEIVAELVTVRAVLGWEIGNLVFMGMGEPLDNFPALAQALRVFLDPSGAAFPQEAITVCTVGLPAGIAALRELGLKRLNLSVSLNAGDEATRASLMPAGRGVGLGELAAALRAYPQRRNFVLGVNYCLIPDRNDGPGAAEGVAAFLSTAAEPGRALLNLIPYNPGSAPLGRAPEEAEIEAFRARLEARGIRVRLRTPRGRGLMAACGQLGSGAPSD